MPRRTKSGPVAPRGWFYSGAVNMEHGGYFYQPSIWGFADVVRVVPCSDAGGPDNEFWVEELTVNFPRTLAETYEVLRTHGGGLVHEYKMATKAVRVHMMVECCVSYGRYDQTSSMAVRIGKPSEYVPGGYTPAETTKVYRAGTKIETIARRCAIDGGL